MKKVTLSFAVSLFFLIFGLIWLGAALQLPFSTSVTAIGGPGTLPTGVLCILILASGYLAISEYIKASPDESHKFIEMDALIRILLMLAAAVIYLVILDIVGYIIATALFIIALLLLFGYRKKTVIAALAVIFPIVLYVAFELLLKIQLP